MMPTTTTTVTNPDGSTTTTTTDTDVNGNVLWQVVERSLVPGSIEAIESANLATIQSAAETALTNNTNYLGIASPTAAQAEAQVTALTRQVDGIIRLLLGLLDSTAGT